MLLGKIFIEPRTSLDLFFWQILSPSDSPLFRDANVQSIRFGYNEIASRCVAITIVFDSIEN